MTFNGSTLTLYVNGVSLGTSSTSTNAQNTFLRIGSLGPSDWTTYYWTGYIGQIRISNNVRSSTVPTSPLTNDANTTFLSNYTNAGIFDQTAKNVLECVGDVKVSTSVYKYGTGSINFDGNGDYLIHPPNISASFGTRDFTIEAWIYWNSLGSESAVMWGSGVGWTLYIYPANKLQWGSTNPLTPANLLTGSTSLVTGQWYHIAVTRASGTVKLFVNGTVDGSVSDTNNYSASPGFQIGRSHGGQFFNGYIDDLRITKDYARYTSNFTPPTSALKDA